MIITPDLSNPFYPFRAGPAYFVEPSTWLSGLVDAVPVLSGKPPLGLITNATITAAASAYNNTFKLVGGTITRNALGLSVGVDLSFTLGPAALDTISMPTIELADMDGSDLTNLDTFTLDGVVSSFKIQISTALLMDFLALDLADGTVYTITESAELLQSTVRARPTNPLQLTVVTPSATGLRYSDDPAPVRYTMPTIAPVKLEDGYNAVVALDNAGAVDISAAPGAGLGVYPVCPEQFAANAPAGITPANNNMNIVGDGCHPTYVYTNPSDPATTKRMLVFGNCEACCTCQDYLNVLKALEKLGGEWGVIWDLLGLSKLKYDFVKDKYRALARRMSTLSVNKGGYVNISVFRPDTPSDKSGVLQLYSSLSIFDPIYADEDIEGVMTETLHVRSVTLTGVSITVAGTAPAPMFIDNPNQAAASRFATLTHDGTPTRIPFQQDFVPSLDGTQTLIIDPQGLGKIDLRPGANIMLDLTACVGSPNINQVTVGYTWIVEIVKASQFDNPAYNAEIINDDPKATSMFMLAEYVVPGL